MKTSSTQEKSKLDTELRSPPKEEVVESIPREQLKEESAKRAKKRPVLQKIARVLSGQKDSPYRELIINAEPLETRVALLVDGVLEKFEVERAGDNRMVGAIFAGKIQNLEPGLKAAFVDIGQPKNAFLHYWDILPAAEDKTVEIVRSNETEEQKKRKSQKPTLKDIPKLYPIGSNIVVQITKSQIGSKGPRTTTNLSLPGRFLVLMPFSGQCGISRKIESKQERDRLKDILKDLTLPEGMGVIIRTAGEGKKARYFVRDLHMLLKKWEKVEAGMKAGKPALLYQEPDIIERTVRDFLTEDIDRVLVDSEDRYQSILENISEISPRSKRKIHQFKEDIPIFERFNIERQIEQTFQRTVPLPSGGEIVIDETEALVAIDVNTGSHKGKGDKGGKNFILNANLEAASEAARQIRLRNIGGLIILDFIDMKNKRDRQQIFNRMRREMAKDKAKSHVLPISQLGIMQMTRQRHAESLSSGIYTGCPYCTAKGIVKSSRTMSVEIQRKLVSVIRHLRNTSHKAGETIELAVLLHPTNLERLRHEDEEHLIDIEKAYNVSLSFKSDYGYHVENFRIVDPATGHELR